MGALAMQHGAQAGPASALDVPVVGIEVRAHTIPTDAPESDGTLAWDSTTAVVVEAAGGDRRGLGWTYGPAAIAPLVRGDLAPVVVGRRAGDPAGSWSAMVRAMRNAGRPGLVSMAIAAVDVALWDLEAHLLGVALVDLLGARRESVECYGSGGFTSYDEDRLQAQLGAWAAAGMRAVKMKVGRDPGADPRRVGLAREAIGPEVALMVDANGAHDRKGALAAAERFAAEGVGWFEEPVSSDDLAGLRLCRDRMPIPIEVAAGEYGYAVEYFRRMLEAGAVDVLQADVTRCAGITEFMRVAALCEAWSVPLSAHTAPALHAHLGCAAPGMRHVEYFHDHARVEALLFDGAPAPDRGSLAVDRARPGLGVELRRPDAARFEVDA